MTAYRELIERLENATGSDENLDVDVAVGLGLARLRPAISMTGDPWTMFVYGGLVTNCPRFTASIDAALSLVEKMLPTRDYDLTLTLSNPAFSAVAHIEHWDGGEWFAQKQTAPLAILIALLRALEAESREEEG